MPAWLDSMFGLSPETRKALDEQAAVRDAQAAKDAEDAASVDAERAARFNEAHPGGFKPQPYPGLAGVAIPDSAPPADNSAPVAQMPEMEINPREPYAPGAPPPPPAVARRGGPGTPTMRMPEMDIQPREPYAPGAPPPTAPPATVEDVVKDRPTVRGPSADDEYAAAKAQSDAIRQSPATALLEFLSGFASNTDQLHKGIQDRVNAPVADLLAQKKYLDERIGKQREVEEYDRKKAMDSNKGPLAEQVQMLGRIYHPEWSNAEIGKITPNMLPALKDVSSFAQLEKHQTALEKNQEAELRSREKIAEGEQGVQREGHRLQYAAAMAKEAGQGGPKNTSEQISVPGTPVAPGYSLGNVAIKGQEAADFRKAVASSDSLKKSAARLTELLTKHGTESLNTDVKKEMDEKVSSMQIAVKDMANLGAISKTDMDIILGQIPDVTTLTPEWWANNRGTLKALAKDIDDKLASKANSLGLQRAGGGAAPSAGAPTGPTRTVNGVTKTWDGSKWV